MPILDKTHQDVDQFSGDPLQRAASARAMYKDTPIILRADESTDTLNAENGDERSGMEIDACQSPRLICAIK